MRKTKIIVNRAFEVGKINKRIYGSFIEHIGRAVYGGIYEPQHATADEDGFRQDVLSIVKKLDVPIVRYPGGNFVSGYRWEDGIGDKSKRPRRLDLSWCQTETNEVGIDEFQKWAKKANAEVMMAVNLGTRNVVDALNLLEYCNLDTDTYYANLRKENGYKEPFKIKTWCLGNEMDGSHQVGQKTAEEYGKIACETAKLMRMMDPSLELIVCGSTGYDAPTFGEWDLKVLDYTYKYVDYISLHWYFFNHSDNTADFLGRSVLMNEYIKAVVAICDIVKAKNHSDKTVNLSFDEWNVWRYNNSLKVDGWPIAPALNEEAYTFEDALVVACMMMVIQNNCDRVKIACLAQLVNVIAPIMTETGGGTWLQTIFYPFYYAAKYGHGKVLQTVQNCESYTTTDGLDVPYIEATVINNDETEEIVLFAVNKCLDEDMELDVSLEGFETANLTEHIEFYCDDLKAVNEMGCDRVLPNKREISANRIVLKKHSWNMLKFKY